VVSLGGCQGILDDQFSQLQMLQDESTPDFVEEVVTLFFDDSEKLLENLSGSLNKDPVDYKVVDGYVHTFKGSSASVGAQRVMKTCITFRYCCDKGDKQGWRNELWLLEALFLLRNADGAFQLPA
jgi:histidine-containing phosphotransfer protein